MASNMVPKTTRTKRRESIQCHGRGLRTAASAAKETTQASAASKAIA